MNSKIVATNAKSDLVFKQEKAPFTGGSVRMAVKDGELWFVGSDVCKILDIVNSRDALSKLDADEKDDVAITDTIGRKQNMTTINESGLYNLIFSSRKPEAKEFKKWITSEVIPSIRKTGAYISDNISTEQVEWLLENQIIEKLILATKNRRVNIHNLVIGIIEKNDVRYFWKKSYEYISRQLTDNHKYAAKELMFNRLIDPVISYGNSLYLKKQLEVDEHIGVLNLIKALEKDRGDFLSRSRGKHISHKNKLISSNKII